MTIVYWASYGKYKWSNFRKAYLAQLAILVLILTGCSTGSQKNWKTSSMPAGMNPITLRQLVYFEKDVHFDTDVTIMPGALISTAREAIVTFGGKVNVLGESQVFETYANLQFEPGTLSVLNVAWFGAKGYDNQDDTEAFKRTLEVARDHYNSVTIDVPVGLYLISKTLSVECDPANKKSINLQGISMSNSSIQGSSICWKGESGGTLMEIRHVNNFYVENLDFKAGSNNALAFNISFKPYVHQAFIRHCSFSGAEGLGSANINLNSGNGDQVSEIHIENCIFNGTDLGGVMKSPSAIIGGLANTKNFYIRQCAFSSFSEAAINIGISDVFRVESCTFANNEIDIACGLCGTYASSNYSEGSKAFFSAGASSNLATATLINNVFTGLPRDGFVVRDGSGQLYLMHNIFGGGGFGKDENRIRWESSEFNSVYSVGNFYKNASEANFPFYDRSGRINRSNVTTLNDGGGNNGPHRKLLSN